MRVVVALLADGGPESNKAGPLGLLVIVLLGIAVYFLYRSMVRHLNKVPESFDEPGGPGDGDNSAPDGAALDGVAPDGVARDGTAPNGTAANGGGQRAEPPES
jgi:hypothetical protein